MIGRARSSALELLERSLVAEFSTSGVERVEYVAAFTEPFDFWVWLGTTFDRERDALVQDESVDSRIRRFVSLHGLDDHYDGFTVESQETVDREYEGSWFYRLR